MAVSQAANVTQLIERLRGLQHHTGSTRLWDWACGAKGKGRKGSEGGIRRNSGHQKEFLHGKVVKHWKGLTLAHWKGLTLAQGGDEVLPSRCSKNDWLWHSVPWSGWQGGDSHRLDSMILEAFCNLNDSVTPWQISDKGLDHSRKLWFSVWGWGQGEHLSERTDGEVGSIAVTHRGISYFLFTKEEEGKKKKSEESSVFCCQT